MQDWPLLRQYAEHNSETAFAKISKQYIGLVFATCLRELGSRPMAEDATQIVFLLLARKAPRFRRDIGLSGWLFQTARYVARNMQRQERRRAIYEQKAAESKHMEQSGAESTWAEIEPMLNDALASLKHAERECVLLRFFQGLSFVEIGTAVGSSEEAARKRCSRALEKLRRYFAKEDWYLSDTALAAMMSTHAVIAAPATCTAAIAQMAVGAGHLNLGLISPSVGQLLEGVLRTMKLVQLKWVGGAAAVLLVCAASYSAVQRQAATANLRAFNINDPIPVQQMSLNKPNRRDKYRNVLVTGRVIYADGKPAPGYLVYAQIQNSAMLAMLENDDKTHNKSQQGVRIASQGEQEASWNSVLSRSDGSYTLPVAANVPYNIMVHDNAGSWIAASIQGIRGRAKATVLVPDLVLTSGSVLEGTVTHTWGKPASNIPMGDYGPATPDTSANILGAETDMTGVYRMRVAPGINRIYDASMASGASKSVFIKPEQVKIVNFAIP